MAIAHLNATMISRGNRRAGTGTKNPLTQSAIAAAAYRSGERLYDAKLEKFFDYSRKRDVVHCEIMTPIGAPAWAKDRESLWHKVEAAEKRINSQLARSLTVGLQRELSFEQNLAVVRRFAQENFVRRGMIADIAIHEPKAMNGGTNPHAHILLTMRDVTQDGFAAKKNREWNQGGQDWKDRDVVEKWRQSWEQINNEALEAAGRSERIDMKSYKRQGLNKAPQQHLGYEAGAKEKRGIATEKGNKNREIRHQNKARQAIDGLYPEAKQAGKGKGRAKASDRRKQEATQQKDMPEQSLAGVAKVLKPEDTANSQRDAAQTGAAGSYAHLGGLAGKGKATEASGENLRSRRDESRQAEEQQAYRRYRQKVASILRSGPMRKLNPQTINTMLHGLRDRSSIYAKDAFTHFMLLRNSRELAEELEQERRLDKSYER